MKKEINGYYKPSVTNTLNIIKDKTGVYVEVPKNKIKFNSKESKIIYDLLTENQELKKQLEETLDEYIEFQEKASDIQFELRDDRDNYYERLCDSERKQKKFIKYLEDEIKQINPDNLSISELINSELDNIKFTQYLIYKEILQKYKSIIGVSDENKTTI